MPLGGLVGVLRGGGENQVKLSTKPLDYDQDRESLNSEGKIKQLLKSSKSIDLNLGTNTKLTEYINEKKKTCEIIHSVHYSKRLTIGTTKYWRQNVRLAHITKINLITDLNIQTVIIL